MIGKKISHYQIVEKLGEGGMGVVYKAEDTKLQRTVALKFLPASAVENEEDKTRFISEARAAAALDHSNICTVYEINEADGQSYIAMAYVEGSSLRDMLDEKPLKVEESLKIAVQIAKGLNAAHEKGVVHRDIKSANIMVTPKGRAKIMDFGLADRGDVSHGSDEGSTLGTVAYSSPEQIGGDAMDARTDIWSFGVTLYEMVTGQLPFRGDYEQAIVYSILNETPEPATGMRTGVPVELERIINKAMAKNVDDRYQHVEDMLFDLKTLQNELDPTMSTTGSRTGTRPIYEQETSFFRKLLDRHVFQVLAVYFAAIWGATKLIEWIVGQFVLSPHWVNITTIALGSLIPTVFLLAYFRGARGPSGWSRPEKFGIPANLVVSAALLILVFQGKDIGAATKTVAVENEEGETIERVIPKSEFRKRLALYVFESVPADTTLDWMQYTVPLLLEYDILQDQFLDMRSAFHDGSYNELRRAGFTRWNEAPVALKRKIAREAHYDFFLLGQIRVENGEYVVETQLHDTHSGKITAETTHRNPSLLDLIDGITVQLKKDMGIPAGYLEEATDLALAEMVTNSENAVRYMGPAMAAGTIEQDWQRGIDMFEAALREDSTIAHAHFALATFYIQTNQSEKGHGSYEKAMRYVYKMPERMQFIVKANYYFFKQQPDKAFAVLKMMAELYPTDVFSHLGLAQIYIYRNEIGLAIAEYEKIVELDPASHDHLHTIGDLARQMGDNEKALEYYTRFAELNPRKSVSFTTLGGFHEALGEYDEARTNYEKALVVDPGLVRALIDLADIECKLGHSEAALEQYHEGLRKSRTAEERIRAQLSLSRYHVMHGQIDTAIELMKQAREEEAATLTPLMAQMRRTANLNLYVDAGRPEEAFEVMKDIESKVSPPFDKIVGIGYTIVYQKLGDVEKAREALARFEEYIVSYKVEVLRQMIFEMKGKISEVENDFESAVSSFEQQLALAPSETEVHLYLGRCYRKLEQYDKAEEHLLAMHTVFPYDPKTNYQLALMYRALGDGTRASEHLDRALHIWKDADPGYKPAIEARAMKESWKTIQ